jgi:GTPase SAR1 family protein
MSILSARRNVLLTVLLATLSLFVALQTANAQTPGVLLTSDAPTKVTSGQTYTFTIVGSTPAPGGMWGAVSIEFAPPLSNGAPGSYQSWAENMLGYSTTFTRLAWDTIPQDGFERATGFYYATPSSGITLTYSNVLGEFIL